MHGLFVIVVRIPVSSMNSHVKGVRALNQPDAGNLALYGASGPNRWHLNTINICISSKDAQSIDAVDADAEHNILGRSVHCIIDTNTR